MNINSNWVIIVKIEEISINDRPREKIINKGPEYLEDYELLAIMLGSGTKDESILDLSKRLVKDYGLERLFRMKYKELNKISGIKIAKASKLMATFEIARRVLSNEVNDIELKTSKDVYEYVKRDYMFLEYERITILLVNSKLRIINKKIYENSEYDRVELKIKDIIKFSIDNNAFGIFIIHNHPTGNLRPSIADIESTKKIASLCDGIGVHFFDHLIISGDKFYSFSDCKDN